MGGKEKFAPVDQFHDAGKSRIGHTYSAAWARFAGRRFRSSARNRPV
jgi:hypothetical protein